MMMRLTTRQLQRLDDFNAHHDTDWAITDEFHTQEIDGEPRELITIRVRPYSQRGFDRFMDEAGNIFRYDDDTDTFQRATAQPLTGSYRVTQINGTFKTRTYNY